MKKFKRFLFSTLYFIFHSFYRIRKQILFVCYGFTQYSCSPRRIAEKMHEMYPDFKLIWLCKDMKEPYIKNIPTYIEVRKFTVLSFLKYLCSSFCIVNNCEYTGLFKKKKKQFFIQTYHGDRGFKKVLFSDNPSIKDVMDYKVTDLCLAASEYGEIKHYRESFRYNGEVLRVGLPRNDLLINNSNSNCDFIKKKIGIQKDKKMILYAPTFRDSEGGNIEQIVDLEKLNDLFGDKYQICIRLHRASYSFNKEFSQNIINVSSYFDMSDLLSCADVLISDYSSCVGDFALTGRPIILAIFDYKKYISESRKLFIDPENCGLSVAHNNEELFDILRNHSADMFKKESNNFLNLYKTNETGKSSEIVCKRINDMYMKTYKIQNK